MERKGKKGKRIITIGEARATRKKEKSRGKRIGTSRVQPPVKLSDVPGIESASDVQIGLTRSLFRVPSPLAFFSVPVKQQPSPTSLRRLCPSSTLIRPKTISRRYFFFIILYDSSNNCLFDLPIKSLIDAVRTGKCQIDSCICSTSKSPANCKHLRWYKAEGRNIYALTFAVFVQP